MKSPKRMGWLHDRLFPRCLIARVAVRESEWDKATCPWEWNGQRCDLERGHGGAHGHEIDGMGWVSYTTYNTLGVSGGKGNQQ